MHPSVRPDISIMGVQSADRRFCRRGVIGLYTSFALITLVMALSSLAVDFGRAQLAKTELRRAIDAATRAAAAGMATSQATAKNAAATVAGQNLVDGKPLTLNTATEISFAAWNGQDAVTISVERPISLIFGRFIGMDTCTVTAHATATLTQSPQGYGIIGLDSIRMSGNSRIDSYNSQDGAYSGSISGDDAQVASNGTWNFSGNSGIQGNLYYRGSTPPDGRASGSRTLMPQDLSLTVPTLPSSIDGNLEDFHLSGNSTYTLHAGDYKASSFSMSGNSTLNIDASGGPVNLYVTGTFNLSGNAKIKVTGNIPANFNINMCSSSTISYSGNSHLYAVINAPASRLNLSGNHGLCGTVHVKNINMSGNSGIHYDTSLGSLGGGTGSTIALVE